jgi:hypothetical protein
MAFLTITFVMLQTIAPDYKTRMILFYRISNLHHTIAARIVAKI